MGKFMFDNTEKLTKNKKYTQAELFKIVLEKEVEKAEPEGRENFEDAYGDDMPPYFELQKGLSEKLDIKVYNNIAKDVLQRFFKTAERETKFTTKYVPDNEIAKDLIKN